MKAQTQLLFGILIILCQSVYSQTISSITYTGTNVNPLTCSSNEFTVQILGGSGMIDLNIDYPLGAELSYLGNPISGNIIPNISLNGATTTVVYELYFPCSMIPPIQQSGIYNPLTRTDVLTIGAGGSSLATNYLIDYPILVPNVVGGNLTSAPGNTVSRDIIITNTGTGPFNGTINFLDDLPCTSVLISSIVVQQGATTIASSFVMPPSGYEFNVTGLLPNESITITEQIDYISCVDPSNNCPGSVAQSSFIISSGCNTTDLCRINYDTGGSITRNQDVPNVKIYRFLPQDISSTENYPFETICSKPASQIGANNPADFTTREFRYVNTGNATAFDVYVDFRENPGNIIPFPKNDIVLEDKVTVTHLDASGVVQNTTVLF